MNVGKPVKELATITIRKTQLESPITFDYQGRPVSIRQMIAWWCVSDILDKFKILHEEINIYYKHHLDLTYTEKLSIAAAYYKKAENELSAEDVLTAIEVKIVEYFAITQGGWCLDLE